MKKFTPVDIRLRNLTEDLYCLVEQEGWAFFILHDMVLLDIVGEALGFRVNVDLERQFLEAVPYSGSWDD